MVKMRDEKGLAALRELIDSTSLTDIVMLEVGSYAGESADTFAIRGIFKESAEARSEFLQLIGR